MTLPDILERHRIYTIKSLRQKTGWTTKQAWYLWHGKVKVSLPAAKILVEQCGVTWDELMELDEVSNVSA